MKAASNRPQTDFLNASPRVVGVAASRGELRAAARLWPKSLDAVELRLDALPPSEDDRAVRGLARIGADAILTIRHFSEGGLAASSASERSERFLKALDTLAAMGRIGTPVSRAMFVDVELRQSLTMASVARRARSLGVGLILSFHDFRATPSTGRLLSLARRAQASGADLVKIACMPHSAADLAKMLGFIAAWRAKMPYAIMGMGALGPASRLLFARLGSALNYGFIKNPSAPGQWSAARLKSALASGEF